MKDLYIIISIIIVIGIIYYIHIKEKNKKDDDNNNNLSVNNINTVPENNMIPVVYNPDIVLDYPIDDTYYGGWFNNRYPFFRNYHHNYNHHRQHDDYKHLDFRMPSKRIINHSHRR